jgi:hypothetical protein
MRGSDEDYIAGEPHIVPYQNAVEVESFGTEPQSQHHRNEGFAGPVDERVAFRATLPVR